MKMKITKFVVVAILAALGAVLPCSVQANCPPCGDTKPAAKQPHHPRAAVQTQAPPVATQTPPPAAQPQAQELVLTPQVQQFFEALLSRPISVTVNNASPAPVVAPVAPPEIPMDTAKLDRMSAEMDTMLIIVGSDDKKLDKLTNLEQSTLRWTKTGVGVGVANLVLNGVILGREKGGSTQIITATASAAPVITNTASSNGASATSNATAQGGAGGGGGTATIANSGNSTAKANSDSNSNANSAANSTSLSTQTPCP